ncbi:MAG: glycoside hydrolase family 30 protein [Saprospiraceae bacterium]|nr:glycoside hydrolase family 30 protein [Saprospiraceae bacterium]
MKHLAITLLTLMLLWAGCTQPATHESIPSSDPVPSFAGATVALYTTAAETGERLALGGAVTFAETPQPLETEIAVFVDPSKTYQTMQGIGGALTDASAEVFAKLPAAKQEELLQAYYDPEKGIGYTLARTNIHSCDFSSESYTYVTDEDKALGTFDISHDRQYRIPMIKRAIAAAGGKLQLFVSPWSPPAFMKTNHDMLHGGKLIPEYYDAWALYYTKFIKAYEAEGIPVWGLSIQNEPMATQTWESCIYTAEEERDFLKAHLGPALDREGMGDKKVIVWDHNRDLLPHRAFTILEDPEAAKYVWGVGFHWYEVWAGGDPMFANEGIVKQAFPDKELIFTEGCAESFDSTHYQYWPNAERYGRAMINDFNQGTAGWTDWNVLLDEMGGPNHVGNFCFAPVHADTRTGALIYTPSYYYIGHFSKFIRPGAVRVSTASSRSVLQATTFRNTDGTYVTVVMNNTGTAIDFKLQILNQAIIMSIPAHGMQSIIYSAK